LLTRRQTLEEGELLNIVLPILGGLEKVHERGYIHRDIKPANIFIREDGSPVLIDFGSARQALGAELTTLVSPGYAPFEQYCSKGEQQGPWTDIYGLGATLYRAVTGQPPQDALDRSRAILEAGRDTLIDVGEIGRGRYSARFLKAIDYALQFRQKNRPQTVAEWLRKFGALADTRPNFNALNSAMMATTIAADESRTEPITPAARRTGANVKAGDNGKAAKIVADGPRVSGPVRLMQVMPRALSLRLFPLLVTTTRRSNLVRRDDAFVGRDADFFALDQLLEAARVVTVLGPGGTGKTRLAVEYAVRSSDRFPGGTWFADQAGSTSKDDVAGAVARAMLVPLQGPEAPVEVVGRALRGTATLVVMDNLEQVAAPAREVMTAWLAAAPEARFLATSQVPIGVAGERRHELGPLADEEAVRLFIERARSVRPDFERTDLVAIEAIVARLDRLPLGVELAASRCDVMSPRTIEERLGERFRLLARSDATGRHATLRGAIDWSWDLLAVPDRHALAQCAVFRGGFELDDAEAVLDLSGFPDAPWTVDVVSALRRRSLMYARDAEGALRFGLYESIREYAGERLVELGGRDAAMARHVRHFAARGLHLADELCGPEDLACCQRLERDRENLLAAWERAKTGSPDERASLAVALARLLRRTGPAATITTILAEACGGDTERIDPSLGARLWCARGEDARIAVVIDDARHALDVAIDLARGREPRWMLGHALRERAMLQVQLGRTDQAVVDMQVAAESHRAAGNPDHEAMARVTLGFVLARLGRVDEALVSIEHGMALARKHSGPLARTTAAFMHALLLAQHGRLAEARELLADTLPELRRCGERHTETHCLTLLGSIEAVLGCVADAEMHLAEARRVVAPILRPGAEAAIDILDASIVVARSGRDAEVVRVQRERLAPLGRPGLDGGRPILESSIVANFHYGLFERACDGV
jgi:predicted ATPase